MVYIKIKTNIYYLFTSTIIISLSVIFRSLNVSVDEISIGSPEKLNTNSS